MVDINRISLRFIDKLEYTASDDGMRYMIKKMEKTTKKDDGTEEKKKWLRVYIWPEPLCFAKTDPSKITEKDFPFSEEGRREIVDYLNMTKETNYRK